MAIERHDNGDGTTTFSGVDVTIPNHIACEYDVVAVRQALAGEIVSSVPGVHTIHNNSKHVWPILAPRPTWKPPASLAPGAYAWNGSRLSGPHSIVEAFLLNIFRDWTAPPKMGKWQVNEDGTATYLGEA